MRYWLIITTLFLFSCSKIETERSDYSTQALNKRISILADFFGEFEDKNPNWTKSLQGRERFKSTFRDEMISNIEFAKAIASIPYFNNERFIYSSTFSGLYSSSTWNGVYIFAFGIIVGNIIVECTVWNEIPALESCFAPYIHNVKCCEFNNRGHGLEVIEIPTFYLGSFIIGSEESIRMIYNAENIN